MNKLHCAAVTKHNILHFLWLLQQLLLRIFLQCVKNYVSQLPFRMPLNVIVLYFSQFTREKFRKYRIIRLLLLRVLVLKVVGYAFQRLVNGRDFGLLRTHYNVQSSHKIVEILTYTVKLSEYSPLCAVVSDAH